MKDKTNWKLIFLIVVLLFLDQLTKGLAKEFIKETFIYSNSYPYGGIGVFEGFLSGIDFSIGYVENKGAAFGFFYNYPKILLIFRVVLITWLSSFLFYKEKRKIVKFALACILAGALGNLLDTVKQKYVIDFLNFHFFSYPFPLFNLADSFISVGGLMLLFLEISILKKTKEKHT